MNRRAWRATAALALLTWPGAVWAGRLGTGTAPEVSLVRTIGALLICLLIAGLAIFYLRFRRGAGFAPSLRRLVNSDPQIEIRELRRLAVQHSIALVRHGDREFLLVLSPTGTTVLDTRETDPADGSKS